MRIKHDHNTCLSHVISSSDVKHIDGGEVLGGTAGEEMVCEAQMTPCGNREGGLKKKYIYFFFFFKRESLRE